MSPSTGSSPRLKEAFHPRNRPSQVWGNHGRVEETVQPLCRGPVHDDVDPEDLHSVQRILKVEHGRGCDERKGGYGSAEKGELWKKMNGHYSRAQLEPHKVGDIVIDSLALFDRLLQSGEVVVTQDHVCSLLQTFNLFSRKKTPKSVGIASKVCESCIPCRRQFHTFPWPLQCLPSSGPQRRSLHLPSLLPLLPSIGEPGKSSLSSIRGQDTHLDNLQLVPRTRSIEDGHTSDHERQFVLCHVIHLNDSLFPLSSLISLSLTWCPDRHPSVGENTPSLAPIL